MPQLILQEEEASLGKRVQERSLQERLHYGLIVIDKPPGPTSHEVSSFVRKILGLKKAGHTGTLDANVSGVLPTLLGEACKASKFVSGRTKTYVCVMRLGAERSKKELEAAFENFRGKIWQKPPLASAVAKKLRVRQVYSLEVLEVEGRDVLFQARVDAGTYIRNICFDAGEVLGCGAEMAELRRVEAAGFTEDDAITLQELSDLWWLYQEKGIDELSPKVIPVENALQLKKVVASDGALHAISTGADLAVPGVISLDDSIKRGDIVEILSGKGELVCVARALMSADEIAKTRKGIAFDVERVIHAF
ncbi:MAG: RNA-guided pseudouridylation complex pseudouridine synthase subunit Cbf5 [Candidatus Norongarragalinales archaeon]